MKTLIKKLGVENRCTYNLSAGKAERRPLGVHSLSNLDYLVVSRPVERPDLKQTNKKGR